MFSLRNCQTLQLRSPRRCARISAIFHRSYDEVTSTEAFKVFTTCFFSHGTTILLCRIFKVDKILYFVRSEQYPVFFRLDVYSKNTTAVHQIFGGYLRSQVKCLMCEHKSNTYDPMLDLALDIKVRRIDSPQL